MATQHKTIAQKAAAQAWRDYKKAEAEERAAAVALAYATKPDAEAETAYRRAWDAFECARVALREAGRASMTAQDFTVKEERA